MKKSAGHRNVKGHDKVQVRPTAPARSPWPWVLLAALCVLVAAGTTWALLEFVIWARVPGALVGKWVVEGGEQDGATFDFFRGGTMLGHINLQGREGIIEARVRVQDGTLLSTTQNPNTGRDETRAQKIRSLTARELVLEDDRGHTLRMTRAD
jgi:hypothetical protein